MLRYSADIRTLLTIAFYFGLLALGFSLEFSWQTFAIAIPIAWLSFTCAVITHNTIHTPLFESKTLNRLFQVVLTVLVLVVAVSGCSGAIHRFWPRKQ